MSLFVHYRQVFWGRHITGPGGIAALLPIALPMVLSQLFDTLMMFVDRLFLAHVSGMQMAACMSGGLTAWMCLTLPVGVIGYASTLVAHAYGAKRFTECPAIVKQALLLALVAYPLVFLLAWPAALSFAWAGHDPIQIPHERQFFWILIVGGFNALIRTALTSFFSGIGRTRVIMEGNALALVVNVVVNYLLIFGKCGFPRLELLGAGIGTVLAGTVMTLYLAVACRRALRAAPYRDESTPTVRKPWLEPALLRRLLRFGLPSGVEQFLCMMAFTQLIFQFHAMGAVMAQAVTVVFNWDMLSFIPMVGMQAGVATLVGQSMGAGQPEHAVQATWSGLKVTWLYGLVVLLLFMLMPASLVRPFAANLSPPVIALAVQMLMMASFYVLFDGMFLVFSGALRGAGDTLWVMIAGIGFHLFLTLEVAWLVHSIKVQPYTAWVVFCLSIIVGASLFYWRFQQGKWKTRRVLPVEDLPPTPERVIGC